ncbi:MAG: protein translocase subunit SecF [Coriobacteriia bacterium]|nr:protein translocase subunit SecF [Coriobacteriia bacterium]
MPDAFVDLENSDGAASVTMNLAQRLTAAEVKERMAVRGIEVEVEPTGGADSGPAGFRVTAAGMAARPLQQALAQAFQGNLSDPFPQVEQVGPHIAGSIRVAAVFLTVMAWLVMICYIWFRFHELRWGVAGVIALVHDVLVTVGFLAFFGKPFNMQIIAALLTIIGYSINDTIVVFDRIRENRRLRREPLAKLVDVSINQTLGRTILTSLTVLVVLVSLFLFGGSSIHDFAFAMIVGVVAGTYSTVFIAAPILAFGQKTSASSKVGSAG